MRRRQPTAGSICARPPAALLQARRAETAGTCFSPPVTRSKCGLFPPVYLCEECVLDQVGTSVGRTGWPDWRLLCHRRLCMIRLRSHALYGTAGRGPTWVRGPRADPSGAARRNAIRQHGPRRGLLRGAGRLWGLWLGAGDASNEDADGDRDAVSSLPSASLSLCEWATGSEATCHRMRP